MFCATLYTGVAAKARSTHSRKKQEGFQKKHCLSKLLKQMVDNDGCPKLIQIRAETLRKLQYGTRPIVCVVGIKSPVNT